MEESEVTEQNEATVHNEVQQEDVEVKEVVQPEPYAENAAQVNLRNMREAKEKAERDLAEIQSSFGQIKAQQELEAAAKQQLPAYGDDDFVEGKHLKKEMDDVKAQLKAYQDQTKYQADEMKLKSKYSDFDKVVNPETIKRLQGEDPEFAETIAFSNSSLYSRGSSTYRRIKDLGIYIEDKHEKDREKAKTNAAKPRPLTSVSPQQGDSPLSMANAFADGLTPELKRQLYKEMVEASKKH